VVGVVHFVFSLTDNIMLDQVLMIEDALTEKQLTALRNMMYVYKELQQEVHNYPEPQNLFTKTEFELFDIFDIN
jgi:hypothetical protein